LTANAQRTDYRSTHYIEKRGCVLRVSVMERKGEERSSRGIASETSTSGNIGTDRS